MIRAVISDMGKVILHFDNRIFFARLAAAVGKSVEEVIALSFEGRGLFNDFDAGLLTPDQFKARVCKPLGVTLEPDEFWAIYSPIFRVIPGTVDILGRAKRTCRLVLLSNTDPVRYAYIQRTYPEVRLFDAEVISCRERLMKPDPRIFELALSRSQAEPPECVFIDDRPENVAAARRKGIEGIVFEEGRTDLEAELRRLGLAL
jgi:FMN phosphatase YigB (HAD superfamily)